MPSWATRVYVYPGARVGRKASASLSGPAGFVTVPQLGRVIGWRMTWSWVPIAPSIAGPPRTRVIGAGSRIDNLVQIGHNVHLRTVLCRRGPGRRVGFDRARGFCGGGGAGGPHGSPHDWRESRIGAQSGVMRDVEAGADVLGAPAIPIREFFRTVSVLRKLAARRGPSAGEG